METEIRSSYTYMGRTFNNLSTTNDDSTAFSDCNSDRSGEFPMTSSQSRRLLLSCAPENYDDLIRQLVSGLESSSIDDQKQAAMELRLIAKNKPENRVKIARAGAIRPLIFLISSSDPQFQEYGVTTILNLSLCDENKEQLACSGAIKPLVRALKIRTSTAKENAACALLRLSQLDENKYAIEWSGAIPSLVSLLESGSIRGKKDASTALYSLCSVKENKIRAVEAGIMKALVELMADFRSNMVDKSTFVMSILVSTAEARSSLICDESVVYRSMVAREGAIHPLVALSQSGTNQAKQKAETLIELLWRPRSGNIGGSVDM
ncbi:hypothetical protein Ccrd_014915 [Cynara cardunculus var. scolymus]|uniref:U-box domain-containing protein n=1 Tax=Cynara cardunculus var. scolymus TaxID=59895 RepID=A0A103YCT5_CYNCS|nr:hypothetical protein Ccrd_014915 [Cynara cardunculus var. scolymus]